MKFDFDKVTDRSGTNSVKWDVKSGELPMWVADMDFMTAPAITDAIVKRAQHGIFGYSTLPDEWYTAYINWWEKRHGVRFEKQEMLFSTGVVPTISCCIRALTEPGDKVLILSPVYYVFYKFIKLNGRTVLDCPLTYQNGQYDIDFGALEKGLADEKTKLMILSNPHNPVGKIWSRDTLAHIGELAEKHGVTVVSDEIHCDLTDPDKEYVPYFSASDKCADNGIVCISPTKAFNLAGIKSSAVVIKDAALRAKVRRELSLDILGEPNAFAVQAAVAAFEQGGEWLDELREYLFANKQAVAQFLENNAPSVNLVASEATYLLWLDCTALGIGSKKLTEHIRSSTGLFLTDGEPFGGDGFLRLNIACPRAMLMDGLGRLKKAIVLL